MGKHLRHTQSGTPTPNGHSGCMWGIIHILKYHHWHYIRKRLPHRRHGGDRHGSHGVVAENARNLHEQDYVQAHNSGVEEKMQHHSHATKQSVKTRLKSLIAEEISKKKGRHHRTSTYPVRSQLMRSDALHRLEPSDRDPFADIVLNDVAPRSLDPVNEESSSATSSLDAQLPGSSDEPITNQKRCKECSSAKSQNYAGHNQADKNQLLFEEKLEDQERASMMKKLVNRHRLTADASFYQSKEFLDALDIINMNKDFFIQILQDPESPLADHFNKQQAFSSKMKLAKSESFPLPGLSGKRGSGPIEFTHKEEGPECYAKGQLLESVGRHSSKDKQSLPECKADAIVERNQAITEISDNPFSDSAHHLKNHGKNVVVMRRFKDLKKKIKNAIKESKSERHRIAMDAVLHKIPHGHGSFKDLDMENIDHFKDPSTSRDSKDSPASSCTSDLSIVSMDKSRCFRRTSSLSESLDKYCQLYDSSFNRGAKHHISERLKLRNEEASQPPSNAPKSLGRIFSLPDLKSYSYQPEDVSDVFSPGLLNHSVVVDGDTLNISNLDEERSLDIPLALEYSSHFDAIVKRETKDNTLGLSEEYSGHSMQDIELVRKSNSEWPETSPVLVLDSDDQEDTTARGENSLSQDSEIVPQYLSPFEKTESVMDTHMVAESGVNLQKVQSPNKNDLNGDIDLHVQVHAKDKAKFDYVRDVLELSGFSVNETLGTWHSDDQPVDPCLYEEVHGCMLLDPDCSGNEEGGNCSHLLLFDLINEVLMEVYERSHSYCPVPLSSLSHTRPMPSGYHVLEEVWANISWYLRSRAEEDQSLDYVVTRDLGKGDGWMNLQFDSECVGLQLEDLIFDDLLEQLILSGVEVAA